MSELQNGRVTQVIGPVVDVTFPQGELPPILSALKVSNPGISEKEWNLTLDYRFPESHPLRRLWIRVRGAILENDSQCDVKVAIVDVAFHPFRQSACVKKRDPGMIRKVGSALRDELLPRSFGLVLQSEKHTMR